MQWNKDVKPKKIGVYEREYTVGKSLYSKWDGKFWLYACLTVADAEKATEISAKQHIKWREIA